MYILMQHAEYNAKFTTLYIAFINLYNLLKIERKRKREGEKRDEKRERRRYVAIQR